MSPHVPVGARFYWDSQCRFCNALKRVAQALDWSHQVTFLPLNSAPADIDLGHLTEEDRVTSSHFVTADGKVYSAGRGILALAQILPLTAPLVFVFRLLPYSDALAEYLYKWVAGHRGVPYGGSCKIKLDPPSDP